MQSRQQQTQPLRKIITAVALSMVSWQTMAEEKTGIDKLELSSDLIMSFANAVNVAGNVVVGYGYLKDNQGSRAFRWENGKMVSLGTLNGGTYSNATAVNAAGNVVVGIANDGFNSNTQRAFRWENGSMTSLGVLNNGNTSRATAVNAAGNVVVGNASDGLANNRLRAFRWENGSMTSLGVLNNGAFSQATAVNAAGNVVVGYANDGLANNQLRAFRWENGSMTNLGVLNNGDLSQATAVNAAGNVVVGYADDGLANNQLRAFRWENGSMASLGVLNNGISSVARAVNAAGDVVVGYATDGTAYNMQRAFRWTQATGMQSVEQWLTDNGVSVTGMQALSASGVNDKGNIVVGLLASGGAFIARVISSNSNSNSNSNSGSGLINLDSFTQGLARVSNASALASDNIALVMNGLHSNPMRSLLANGQSSFSVGADVGRQDTGNHDTDLALGEITYAHRFNDALQLNLSAGHTYNNTDTDFGGKTTARSTYIMPQFVFTLPANTYASLDLFYGQGNVDIHRGYLNAGTPEMSTARPDTTSMGARLRVDWRNALTLAKTNITPYSSLTYIQTHMDAYAEQGVAFPVYWNSRTDRATTMHIGFDADHQLSERWTLLGKLEAAHRFENRTAYTSGQIEGLSSFSFAGHDVKQNWLRIGAGAEANFGSGVASLLLNATTKGDAPSYWLSANYRWHF